MFMFIKQPFLQDFILHTSGIEESKNVYYCLKFLLQVWVFTQLYKTKNFNLILQNKTYTKN